MVLVVLVVLAVLVAQVVLLALVVLVVLVVLAVLVVLVALAVLAVPAVPLLVLVVLVVRVRRADSGAARCLARAEGRSRWAALGPDLSISRVDHSTLFAIFASCFHDFPDFSGETSNLKDYNLLEASKYNFLSKCSTRGYYILTNSCVSKPATSCSF